jgi:uncharacterized protein with von Willebrand factor type A (vWA) domain
VEGAPTRQPEPIVDRLVRLARGLHGRGFDVAPADTLDAAAALAHIDLARRSELRECLRATLVKQPDPQHEFDALFDRLFPAAVRLAGAEPVELTEQALVDALIGGDLHEAAAALVDAHSGLDGGDARGERHHVRRVLRAADLARLMMLALRDRDVTDAAELRARVEELKRLIVADVRGRLDADELGGDGPSEIDRIEFLRASRAELEQMRAIVRPLARRIATKLARRRQHARGGRVDMRRTLRHSLASGGVPLDVVERRRRPHRPELYVLCDISGSVAEFSLFTLTLMSALAAELPRTRSFVFVDAVDEITGLLERTGHQIEPWQIMRNTNVIGASGHSDYGAVLEQFWHTVGPELTGTATLLVTGDARSNYRPAGAALLGELSRRCRSVFWLNPEPRREWDLHDSAIAEYRPHCTQVFEVRTVEQLEACIERIL